jgi:hypothetical protein
MAIIERYVTAEGVPPRACQLAHNLAAKSCVAEVVIRSGKVEQFLCRRHAADALASNLTLLAQLVVELYLPAAK